MLDGAPDGPDGEDATSPERVRWVPCPRCGEEAAVGVDDEGVAVEFDCPHGGKPTREEIAELGRAPGSSRDR